VLDAPAAAQTLGAGETVLAALFSREYGRNRRSEKSVSESTASADPEEILKDKRLPSLFRGLMADVFEKLAGVVVNHNKLSPVVFRTSAFKLVSGLLCKNRPVFRPSFQSRYNTNCSKIKKAQTTNGVYLPIKRVKNRNHCLTHENKCRQTHRNALLALAASRRKGRKLLATSTANPRDSDARTRTCNAN
jgi:hypothetical protein